MEKKKVGSKKRNPATATTEVPAGVADVSERMGKPVPAKSKAGAAAKARDAVSKAKRGQPVQQLIQEIEKVRAALLDALEHYRERLTSQLDNLKENLDADSAGRLLSDKKVASLLEEIHSIRLKPEKGRVKDLARLQELIKRLGKVVPERS
jgi:predicted transcriptional regulator